MADVTSRRSRRSQRREEAQRQTRRTRSMLGGLGVLVAIVVLALLWWSVSGSGASEQPVSSISDESSGNHLHGLGYDSDRDRLLLASHYGLFSLEDDQLYQIGDSRDDYMGLSLHPDDPNIVYTSGHPALGGNSGVEKSTDGGLTFDEIFKGVDGETVDFHSMTISPADPDVLYGWFQGLLYRTQDGGDSWEAFQPDGLPAEGLCWGAHCLAAGSGDAGQVYAGTPDGLYVSDDYGDDWALVDSTVGAVAGVGVSPHDPDQLFIYSAELGMAVSNDGGNSWDAQNNGLQLTGDEFVFEVVFDRNDSDRVFLATTGNRVYQSADGGTRWERVL